MSSGTQSRPEVLMITEGDIPTVHIVEATLKSCNKLGVDVRKKLLTSVTAEDFGPLTFPLFIRCAAPILIPWLKTLGRLKRPYFYYLDDCFWKLSGDSALAHYYQHPVVRNSVREGMKHATAVLTNSQILADEVSAINGNVRVLPALHDFSAAEGIAPDPNGELRIGFAGSTSRIDDLQIVEPVVRELLERCPNAIFEFAGVWPSTLPASNRVRFFPHQSDYRAFARFQASRGWAIGLAPLHDTPANRCKTDNKYREYGSCRIAGVYSDQPPYAGSVRANVTGLLAHNDSDQWIRAITWLIENPAERARIGQSAFEDVWSRFRAEVVAQQWAPIFLDALPPEPFRGVTSTIPVHRRLLATLQHWSIQISAAHHEGGIPLVLRRSATRLAQMAGP